jgi:serum/glucocorticoid-regulated kinase 2
MTVSDEGEVMIETLAIADADTGSEIKDEKVSLEDFDMLSVIGKGGFGKVLLVRKKDTREKFAMKVLLKDFIIKRKEVQHTKVEREILATVSHPFLVSLHHAFHTQSKLYLIVDFVSGGELYFHLRKKKQFPEDQAKFFMAELAMALAHLHSLDICYRDLKPLSVKYGTASLVATMAIRAFAAGAHRPGRAREAD